LKDELLFDLVLIIQEEGGEGKLLGEEKYNGTNTVDPRSVPVVDEVCVVKLC